MKRSRNLFYIIFATFIIGGCAVQPARFQVSHLGYEPPKQLRSRVYSIPLDRFKITVEVEEEIFIPGPYSDYAQKLLGIEGAGDTRTETHQVLTVELEKHSTFDPNHIYSLSVLQGEPDLSRLKVLAAEELVLVDLFDGSATTYPFLFTGREAEPGYTDLSMESNVEVTRHTIYKTIITDTSFMQVPVTTEQLERKTLERKAEEAAKLILEIRTDRYYLSSGLVDPFPVEFELETALDRLDRLEREYLSLFIGKSFRNTYQKEFLLEPGTALENEVIVLDRFNSTNGFGTEGEPLQVSIQSGGEIESHRNLFPQEPEADVPNFIYYRVPGWCVLKVELGEVELVTHQTGIFQKGALVREKLLPDGSEEE